MKRLILLLIIVMLAAGAYLRPLPQPTAVPQLPAAPAAEPVSLPWPTSGQGAVGATNYGVLATAGSQTPAPIASIAKVIAALCILQKQPISSGQQGQTITINQNLFWF